MEDELLELINCDGFEADYSDDDYQYDNDVYSFDNMLITSEYKIPLPHPSPPPPPMSSIFSSDYSNNSSKEEGECEEEEQFEVASLIVRNANSRGNNNDINEKKETDDHDDMKIKRKHTNIEKKKKKCSDNKKRKDDDVDIKLGRVTCEAIYLFVDMMTERKKCIPFDAMTLLQSLVNTSSDPLNTDHKGILESDIRRLRRKYPLPRRASKR